jgi:hypothetical protein
MLSQTGPSFTCVMPTEIFQDTSAVLKEKLNILISYVQKANKCTILIVF